MKSQAKNIGELKGDGLIVHLDLNNAKLKVAGDGCRVTVGRNCGSIRICGDGCLVKVTRNDGDIVYKGDGGRIYLGANSTMESVNYVGEGGKIRVTSAKKIIRKDVESGSTTSNDEARSLTDSQLGVQMVNADNKSTEVKAKAHLERRETPTERTSRRKRIIVVTRMSTEETPVSIVGKFVKNWFHCSPSVIGKFSKSSIEAF